MPVSAHDVARKLRERLPDAGVLKVHKLLYYCQGWHLAWTGRPMFRERVEAWENGPVIADFWHAEDKRYQTPSPVALDEEMLTTVDFVLSRYGRLSGRELIDLSHAEQPWRDATDDGRHYNVEMSPDMLAAFFASDEEKADLRRMATVVVEQSGLQGAVLALSRPRNAPIQDDTAELERLLESL